MKRPHFIACNHGCLAREPKGMATNGGCNFPPRLPDLRNHASLLWGYHDDPEVRKFSSKVVGLLDRIYEE